MKITALSSDELKGPVSVTEQAGLSAGIPLARLEIFTQDWLTDCDYRQHSPQTLDIRRFILSKLMWFLRMRGHDHCAARQLREFLSYAANGHKEPGGRWGNPQLTKPVRPRTLHTYHGHLKTFFDWLVVQELIEASPMVKVAAPVYRSDQIQPFTGDHLEGLFTAAKNSKNPKRNLAILIFMLDTGVRASELCSLKMRQLDMDSRTARVVGKGNKERSVYFGREAAKALWQYLRENPREPDEAVFQGDRGRRASEPLTRSGLLQLFERLGKAGGLTNIRCSPHTLRHTFALMLLKGGANAFTLQTMLGHTSIDITQRYVALNNADMQAQHRICSPADNFRSIGRGK